MWPEVLANNPIESTAVQLRRAAHFAHFRADEDDEARADNIHAGGDQVLFLFFRGETTTY